MGVLVRLDDRSERRIAIGERLVIGRDAGCGVHLDDPTVSARHAEIRRTAAGFELEDLDSRRGTYVGGKKVQRVSLCDGDEILIGVHRLRFTGDVSAVVPLDQVPAATGAPRSRFRPAAEIDDVGELRRDYERLRAAFEIGAAFGDRREVRPLLERILEVALDVLRAERTAAVLIDPRSGNPFLRLSLNARPDDEPVKLSTKLLSEVVRRRAGILIGPRLEDLRSESMIAQQIRTAICCPMFYLDELLGVLYVDSRLLERQFEDKDLELLTAFSNQAGSAIKAALTIADVDRVREAERTRLERLVRHLPDGVVLTDPGGRVVLANDLARALLPLLGASAAPAAALPARLAGRALDEFFDGAIHRVELDDDLRRVVEVSGVSIGGGQDGRLLVVRDVSETRIREEQAERQERLAVLGRLVAGIAHDFNNLLTVILTSADSIHQDTRDPATRGLAGEIGRAATGRRA